MLTTPTTDPHLTPGWAAEPKWDGYRAQLARYRDGRILLRSRRGTDMTPSFPEIQAATIQLPGDTGLDGELVVWEADRLAFERLQQRLPRHGNAATAAANQWPAHFVAFDLLRLAGTDTTPWPYHRRRAALEELFTSRHLEAPWTLSPSTTDPGTALEWLDWTAAGLEGLCFKRLTEPYRPTARTWRKYKVRETHDAIVGAVTGPTGAPRSLLLGRYDTEGRLQYTGRTTTLTQPASRTVGSHLAPATTVATHPWNGWTFTAGWGTRDVLDVTLVQPDVVVEVSGDLARDAAGRWRHPVRWQRVRTDLQPADVPPPATL
ncbi:ATP-dependent DNA ligase [Streptomyces phaeoluteigriseus]|uniref:ATP-dependent DNA ligase n=2 Tax=Streptomyces phaeoluteigriseus TaxID=114686 RepID=A0A1V6MZX4_9ACTN|nr:ATP-dependent DNA ligase [Streptomyces phaeoluteigriseus]